jgi:hypothetical protein
MSRVESRRYGFRPDVSKKHRFTRVRRTYHFDRTEKAVSESCRLEVVAAKMNIPYRANAPKSLCNFGAYTRADGACLLEWMQMDARSLTASQSL